MLYLNFGNHSLFLTHSTNLFRLQSRRRKMQYMQEKMDQQRQLQKKEEINEALRERIKCLKNSLAEVKEKKSLGDITPEDKNNHKSSKNTNASDNCEQNVRPVVGGYFGSIFK